MHLYIGYKNYSSWSLRPWILMKVFDIPFDETLLPFFHDDSLDQLSAKHNIPAQVPALEANKLMIWDSLAIAEHLAEQYPGKALWPTDPGKRALARCASAEMHSGFMALRSACPMNCRTQKSFTPDEAVQNDLKRLKVIWQEFEKQTPSGEFLCGDFGIVDAMYAPVAWRISGYGLDVSDHFSRWIDNMKALPAMKEWLEAAKAESWSVAAYDDLYQH